MGTAEIGPVFFFLRGDFVLDFDDFSGVSGTDDFFAFFLGELKLLLPLFDENELIVDLFTALVSVVLFIFLGEIKPSLLNLIFDKFE